MVNSRQRHKQRAKGPEMCIRDRYEDLPRAAVLCENALGETLYLTQLSPQALQRRAEKGYAV